MRVFIGQLVDNQNTEKSYTCDISHLARTMNPRSVNLALRPCIIIDVISEFNIVCKN